jgi:peptide/nickel transport system substrate-binding protein
MKRLCLFLSALTACLALSCARSQPKKAPARDTLYRHLGGDPTSLDPIASAEELGVRVEDLIFRPLIGLDGQRRFVPSLAVSWAVSSDGLVYDLRLDPKAKWEDGSPVTSKDVVYTIERIRDPKVVSVNWRWGFEDVASIETPDAVTAIVRFRRPYAGRLYAFTLPVISAAAYARPSEADRKPVGTGPYRLEAWVPNQSLTLLRRDDVPASAYPFRRIVFRIIPDNSVRYQAGTRGDLDEFYITRDQILPAERSPEFQSKNRVVKVPLFGVVLINWNCRNPILGDPRVRRALAMAWPRAETAKRLYPPDGASLLTGPYPAGAPENSPEIKTTPYDPAASMRLFDEAGLKMGPDGFRRRGGKRVSVELLYPTGWPIYRNLAEILSEAYAKVGVELVQRQLDWAAFSQRFAAGEYDAAPWFDQFVPPNLDPYVLYASSQIPPNGQNTGFYKNPEADRVMDALRHEMDERKRLELYRQAHRLLVADPPADFLWGADQYWGISRQLVGVEISPLGLFHFLPGALGWLPAAAPK